MSFKEDFEDAVVAVLADVNNCQYIITRNESDFKQSPVPALTPEDFVKKHALAKDYGRHSSD